MNTISPKQKRPLRIVGIGLVLVTGIVIISWLVINVVNAVPGSFASLASLAESVRTFDRPSSDPVPNETTLIVTSDVNVVATGETVSLAWSEANTSGSFVFSYLCTNGVTINLLDDSGTRSLNCDTNYNLGGVTSATMSVESTDSRYVDVPYSLAFLPTSATAPSATDEAIITVVNNALIVVTDEEVGTPAVPESPVTESAPITPTAPATPTFTTQYTYTIPVSDPNGRTDLAVRFINTGDIANNAFIPNLINRDSSGAIQFEVKNLGTKTSGTWTYSASLPSGGQYESIPQVALKPNERAVITIGFPESNRTTHTFVVSIDAPGDNTTINNQFSQLVRIRN